MHEPKGFLSDILYFLKMDPLLILLLTTLIIVGGTILYSSSGQSSDLLIQQAIRLGIALIVMGFIAQFHPSSFRASSPWVYFLSIILLFLVLYTGHVGKGAQRWLDIGITRFQPSEFMKIAVPMMVAWYLKDKTMPLKNRHAFIAFIILIVPALLIARQPDLGTALLVGSAGIFVLFLAGISWMLITSLGVLVAALLPVLWYFMHPYQQRRVLTFLNPESDPLGSGYHIIQSKIAIGSGGSYGKGWLNGTQSNLDFLPERSTDFIFSVFGEEFGLFGAILLLTLYVFIVFRGLYIATQAQEHYDRILAGALSLTFFVYFFVNVGMVSGLLPVVGVPLPLVSYGGTSLVTLMASFGIIMSIHSHKRLLSG
jgi:rod shape determining protein RodA